MEDSTDCHWLDKCSYTELLSDRLGYTVIASIIAIWLVKLIWVRPICQIFVHFSSPDGGTGIAAGMEIVALIIHILSGQRISITD